MTDIAPGQGVGGEGPLISDQEHAAPGGAGLLPSRGRSQGCGTTDLCEDGGEGTSQDL